MRRIRWVFLQKLGAEEQCRGSGTATVTKPLDGEVVVSIKDQLLSVV